MFKKTRKVEQSINVKDDIRVGLEPFWQRYYEIS